MPIINDETRNAIIKMLLEGRSQRYVAQNFKVSRCAVQKLYKKFKMSSSIENALKVGRPRKTTIREDRRLIRLSKSNPFASAANLRKEWDTTYTLTIRTVRNILRKYGLFGRHAAKKPLLSKKQRLLRIKWCRNYRNLKCDDWDKFIFSDEVRIELYPKRSLYVRREIGTRFKERYTSKTVKFGGKAIMLWGAIKAN